MPSGIEPEDTAPKPKRRIWRYVFLTLLLVMAVAVATPAVYLSRAGGLKGVLEARLSDSLGGAPVTVGDVGFELRMPSMQLTLLAYDVDLSLKDTSIIVPEASAVFAPGALFALRPQKSVFPVPSST